MARGWPIRWERQPEEADRPQLLSSGRRALGVGVALGLFVLTALGGFILLPYAQKDLQFASLWDAICSAAGLPQTSAWVPTGKVGPRLSEAILTPTTLAKPSQESIGRGATLAQRCAICHGPTGISRSDSPNLAGQYGADGRSLVRYVDDLRHRTES